MTAEILTFTPDTPELAADRATMTKILDRAEKIRAKGPINRGELVGVAHDAAIKARLCGDQEAERHFVEVAAELMSMEISDVVECATTRHSVLHELVGKQ